MNLLTWILSLIAEWLRPLHQRDPVLAPLASTRPADRAETGTAPATVQRDDPRAAASPGLDFDRMFDEDLQRDLSEDEFMRDVAREHEEVIEPAVAPRSDGPGGTVTGNGLSAANPFWRIGDRLLGHLAPATAAPFGASAWAALVILPAAVVLLIQAGLVSLGLAGNLLALVLTVVVLYFTVPLGRLWRRLDRLSLLAAAGDVDGFRQVSARWQADGLAAGASAGPATAVVDPAPPTAGESSVGSVAAGGASPLVGYGSTGAAGRLERAGFSLPLIDGYRDVFAPMLWFTVIGPAGPIAYGLARLAAERRGGLPRRALYWIDWLPSRLAAASFALSGHFDDAMLSFRSALAASRYDRIDVRVDREPGFGLTLILLPTAAGATGIRLASPAIEARLQQASGDHELPASEPTVANFSQLRSLIGRTAMLWGGLWVLLALVD